MSRVPATHHLGLEVKQAKVLDTLSHRLHVPLDTLNRLRRQLRRPAAGPRACGGVRCRRRAAAGTARGRLGTPSATGEIRQSELDRTDLELIQIVLNEPETITWLMPSTEP